MFEIFLYFTVILVMLYRALRQLVLVSRLKCARSFVYNYQIQFIKSLEIDMFIFEQKLKIHPNILPSKRISHLNAILSIIMRQSVCLFYKSIKPFFNRNTHKKMLGLISPNRFSNRCLLRIPRFSFKNPARVSMPQ